MNSCLKDFLLESPSAMLIKKLSGARPLNGKVMEIPLFLTLICCFVRNRYINQGCGVGETISTALAPTISAPEKYTTVIVIRLRTKCPSCSSSGSSSSKNVRHRRLLFCCMGYGPFFNYYLLTLVNKLSSAGALVLSPVPTPAALVSSLTRDADQHH